MSLPSIKRRFGRHLRQMREQADLSQDEAAYRCKISRTYLSQLESGNRNPTLEAIEKIAKGFRLSVRDLMDF